MRTWRATTGARRGVAIAAVLTLAAGGALAPAAMADEVYACDSGSDELYILDTDTGSVVSVIGPITIGGAAATTPVAMAVRPADGLIFINNNSPAAINGLCRVDPATGTGVYVGAPSIDQSLAWGAGRLWSLDGSGRLATIDPATGAMTSLGGPALPRLFGLDFNRADGFLYGIHTSGPGAVPDLLRISTSTGTATTIPLSMPISAVPQSLLFDSSGTLIGSNNAGQLFDIDPATGAVTNVRAADRSPQGMGLIDLGPGPGGRYFGLQHDPRGEAELIPEAGGRLRVSNIGSSGQDGVRIDLGRVESHVTELELPAPPLLPDGAYLEAIAYGELGGAPDSQILSVRATDQGDVNLISADLSRIDPGSATLRVLNGDDVVFEGPLDVAGGGSTPLVRSSQPVKKTDPYWRMDPECWLILEFGIPGLIEVVGGPPVQGDTVMVIMRDAGTPVGDLSRMDLLGAGLGQFLILGEQIGKFGVLHQAVGDVALLAGEGALDVEVPQGVRGGLETVELTHFIRADQGVLLDTLIDNGIFTDITVESGGILGGVAGQALGRVSINNGVLTSDFSALGSDQATLVLLRGGDVVFRGDLPDGELLAMAVPPVLGGCGKLPPDPPCFWLPLDDIFTGVPTGGPPVDFDEIRVLATAPSAPIDALESYAVSASAGGTEVIRFTGFQAIDPFACRADLDGDGELTIFDFLLFQNLFDARDPRADFDGDGRFTIFDFLAFQNAFVAGC
ncbi:MAG: GC-type dockerin domain-anchored protein [Phycisphaerales bacterium]